jgi:hypothetical protein
MRHLLQPLPRQQATFLVTLLMLEGEKDLGLLKYLPSQEASFLQPIARQICETPRKQLLPQLIQELKRLIADTNRSKLAQLDPAWLAELLKTETPQTIAVVLHGLPRTSIQRVFQSLPPQLAQRVPQECYEMHPEIAKQVKLAIEERFPAIPHGLPKAFDVEALRYLAPEELIMLIRMIGTRELAIAFSTVGRGPLMELCRRLSSEDAERLLAVVGDLQKTKMPSKLMIKQAQRTIRAVSTEQRQKTDMIEGAGMHKFANALCLSHTALLKELAYRLPYASGIRFHHHPPPPLSEADQLRLHHEVLHTLHQLAKEGRIPQTWATSPPVLPPLPPEEEAEDGSSD